MNEQMKCKSVQWISVNKHDKDNLELSTNLLKDSASTQACHLLSSVVLSSSATGAICGILDLRKRPALLIIYND